MKNFLENLKAKNDLNTDNKKMPFATGRRLRQYCYVFRIIQNFILEVDDIPMSDDNSSTF